MQSAMFPVRRPLHASVFASVVVGILLGLWGALLSAGSANAVGDNTLSSSNPAPSENVTVAPTQLQLVFTNPLANPNDVNQMGLSLVCDGNIVSLGAAQLGTDLKTVSAPLTQVPAAGACVVSWALPDGSSGAFSFTSSIAAPTTSTSLPTGTKLPAPVTPGDGNPIVDKSPRVGGPLGLFRLLAYIFSATLVGGVILILFAWPEGVEYAVCRRFLRIVVVLNIVALVLVAIYTTAQYTGKGVTASISPNTWRDLWDTWPGKALLFRVLISLFTIWAVWNPQHVLDPGTQLMSVGIIAALAVTYGFDRTGGRLPPLGYASGILHMVAVSAWFGGLVLLSRVVLIGPGEIDLVQAVRGFGRIATRAIPLAIVTGVIATYRFDGFSLVTSQHGRLVTLKILVVGFMAYATWVTRQFVLTRMQRVPALDERMASHLRRAVGTEATAGVVVLALTSWMMATTPIHYYEAPRDNGPRYAFSEELKNDRFRVRFSVSPATTGQNQILIELFEPRRIQEFTVRMTPKAPGYDGYLINVPLTRRGAALLGDTGNFTLAAPGEWSVEISGTTTTGDLEPLSSAFTLSDPAATTTSSLPPGVTSPTTAPPIAPVTTLAPAADTTTPPTHTTSPPSTTG
ncbi:MAG: copper resistance CopC/CopD family protein [Actinomycetota bacterium]